MLLFTFFWNAEVRHLAEFYLNITAGIAILNRGNDNLPNFDIFGIFNLMTFPGHCLVWQYDYIGGSAIKPMLFPEENFLSYLKFSSFFAHIFSDFATER